MGRRHFSSVTFVCNPASFGAYLGDCSPDAIAISGFDYDELARTANVLDVSPRVCQAEATWMSN
jgi:hypothetical protein